MLLDSQSTVQRAESVMMGIFSNTLPQRLHLLFQFVKMRSLNFIAEF